MKTIMTGDEAVARGAWEAGCSIAAAYPGITDDPVALTASPVDSSLIHPGVIKYMEEKGIEVPAHRIPG